jgi:superfamily II DNA or RNA helicase
MDLIGKVIRDLIPTEAVEVTRVQLMGNMAAVHYIGVNTRKSNSKVILTTQLKDLDVVTSRGTFNFQGDPDRFRLFAEAERINSAYQFDPLFAVNCSIVDPLPHQVEAVYKYLLPQPKIRFLIADDTGAGKTIMTGLLIKELIMRGVVERVLIVTPGGLTKQWQEDEMQVKFNLPFTLVNRSLFTADPNVFQTSSHIVTSIDFLCREDVINVAANSHWDLIVFDECHKLSAYDYGRRVYKAKRYEAAERLAAQCEHILLLTATPHRGRTDTFRKLLQLLDEDIFATEDLATERIREISHDGINKFFIRRLKEDMKDWNGQPLYKKRTTQTVAYQLTPEEMELYNAVTTYLTRKKEEASQSRNIHVALALAVMQRRLASSIAAIRNTLFRRWSALQGIVDELNRNPGLWSQRQRIEMPDAENIEEFDDLDDSEREALEGILADPRKFRMFTTAKSMQELQEEAREVKGLFDFADDLFKRNQEEQKYRQLQDLLKSKGVIDHGEKLVIFTEHKDTLLYLEDRLKVSGGFGVATIHGGKNVDERRQAQWDFASDRAQILVCTDAAGEGINLQFCRLLINWDIPWNPNRLEQRMGRIHRYGQKQDVMVFNMVAGNTKEGQVLQRLLQKLDIIRQSIGDDRVYDVIQDVLEDVSLEAIMEAVFEGKENAYTRAIDELNEEKVRQKITEQRERMAHGGVNYIEARLLKEHSDEKRLQPIYVRLFFEKAMKELGGDYTEVRNSIYRINRMPESLVTELRASHNINYDALRSILFCFDKQVFLDYQSLGDMGKVHYINPGNPVFDSVVNVIRRTCREDMLKGTILVSPDDKEEYLAYFLKSQITDNRPSKKDDSIADERLVLVHQNQEGEFHLTSPAKFIDLHSPVSFAKPIQPKTAVDEHKVVSWGFDQVTQPQYEETMLRIGDDAARRREYLESAFNRVIMDLTLEIQDLQSKLLLGDNKVEEKILAKQHRINELLEKKRNRLELLDRMTELSPRAPEVLGCAWVVPLTQVEYEGHYGMSRDDEAEAIAMAEAMKYEESSGWIPQDVSANNEGYDIRSISPEGIKRYIEVKGRSGDDGSVMLTENEMNRLAQLGEAAWLYIVVSCKSQPTLYRIQNPAHRLHFELKTKGVQWFLKQSEWQKVHES